jgi:hypothetical protein
MEKDKKVEGPIIKDAGIKETPKTRQIIIETDGNSINIIKAEVSGTIELTGILRNLIEFINKK